MDLRWNMFKKEIDQLKDVVDGAVKLAGSEIRESISTGADSISLKIDEHVANIDRKTDEHISNFNELVERNVLLISHQLDGHIDKISSEIHSQRKLTVDDFKALIDYATFQIGSEIDVRIEKLKSEASELVADQIEKVKTELGDAATQQKKVAVRNASVAIAASLVMGAISIVYKKYFHGDIVLIDLFRAILFGLASGYAAWIVSSAVAKYITSRRIHQDAFIALASYVGAWKPKGLGGHLFVLVILIVIWLGMSYGQEILELFQLQAK